MPVRIKIQVAGSVLQAISQQLTEGTSLVLGRDPGVEILNHPSISRRHALVYVTREGGLLIRDLNSANGTYVDGHRISDAALNPGQEIRLGSGLNFQITAVEETEPAFAQGWPGAYRCLPKKAQNQLRNHFTSGNKTQS